MKFETFGGHDLSSFTFTSLGLPVSPAAGMAPGIHFGLAFSFSSISLEMSSEMLLSFRPAGKIWPGAEAVSFDVTTRPGLTFQTQDFELWTYYQTPLFKYIAHELLAKL